jgi:hypothetical protein
MNERIAAALCAIVGCVPICVRSSSLGGGKSGTEFNVRWFVGREEFGKSKEKTKAHI